MGSLDSLGQMYYILSTILTFKMCSLGLDKMVWEWNEICTLFWERSANSLIFIPSFYFLIKQFELKF